MQLRQFLGKNGSDSTYAAAVGSWEIDYMWISKKITVVSTVFPLKPHTLMSYGVISVLKILGFTGCRISLTIHVPLLGVCRIICKELVARITYDARSATVTCLLADCFAVYPVRRTALVAKRITWPSLCIFMSTFLEILVSTCKLHCKTIHSWCDATVRKTGALVQSFSASFHRVLMPQLPGIRTNILFMAALSQHVAGMFLNICGFLW